MSWGAYAGGKYKYEKTKIIGISPWNNGKTKLHQSATIVLRVVLWMVDDQVAYKSRRLCIIIHLLIDKLKVYMYLLSVLS